MCHLLATMHHATETQILAWARLVRAHAAALLSIEQRLKAAGLPALEWYDVLLELHRNGPLRPRDLQAHLLLPQYNLSRLLDRMVTAGLIEKQPTPEDGRGHHILLTQAGIKLRQRMWPHYDAAIANALAGLSEEDAKTLAGLLARLSRP